MTGTRELWQLVVDVWNSGLLGIDIGQYLVAALILLAFLLLRRAFTLLIMGRLRSLAKRTESVLDDETLGALEKPVRLIPVVLGVFFAAQYLPLTGGAEATADRLVRSLIVFVLFWGLTSISKPLSSMVALLDDTLSTTMFDWLFKAVRVALAVIGAAIILEIWGIKIGPIIAGLGLIGVAVALGAQDLFKNLISGILVIAEDRFAIGDWILVEGVVEGTVESIGFRSTLVRRFDKAPVYVPNSQLSDRPVTNFTAMSHRRIFWRIGVEYRTTVDQLRHIRDGIEAYILESDCFAGPPAVPTFVRIDRFSDSSIDIMVYCFTRTTDWGEWLELKEALAYRIKEIVEEAGSAFAFPSRSLYIETASSHDPEPFVPPSGPLSQKGPHDAS